MSENTHIPTTQEVVAEVMKEIQMEQNRPSLQFGMQISQNKETTWDKIVKYAILPSLPIIFLALIGAFFSAYNSYKDLTVSIAKIDIKLDNMERRYDSAESKITDHENRIRSLERR